MNRVPIFYAAPFDRIIVTVQYVFRANFNDTYLLDSREILLDGLSREELYWFDPFLGRSKNGKVRFALSGCGEDYFKILRLADGDLREEEIDFILDFIECEDYDESKMLAAHIRVGVGEKRKK